MPPLISIIMPCFNAENNLCRSVSSVLTQTYSNWELITIDDGSQDNTLAYLLAQTDNRIKVLSQENRGVSAARNTGLAAASGDYVAFLDSDDTWDNDFLQAMVPALEENGSVALAYCGWQNIGITGGRDEPFIPPDYERPDKKAMLLVNNRWPIHAALTRLTLVKSIGGFDTHFVVGEDFLLWLEIGCFHKILLVPRVLAYYHHHEGEQASRDRGRAALQILGVQQTFLRRHPAIINELGHHSIRELTLGPLLAKGYDAYWRRDLETAQKIFRLVMLNGGWKWRDLKYLIPAMLPAYLYTAIIGRIDRRIREQ